MIYGYARTSTHKQSIERQIRNIKSQFPAAVILQEVYTRTTMERKEWIRLRSALQPGDTVVFDSVSRMSGNASEGFMAYEELFKSGVELVFLKEPHINTSVYKSALEASVPLTGTSVDLILNGVNSYLMELAKEQIRIAFEQSEKEVRDLHQRTKEGIETARLAGKQIGQQPGRKLNVKKAMAAKEIILRHAKDFGGSLSDAEVRKLAGIAPNTYYKYKRELKTFGCQSIGTNL